MGRKKISSKIREIVEQDHERVKYVSRFDSVDDITDAMMCYKHKETGEFLCFDTEEALKGYRFILDYGIDKYLTFNGGFSTKEQKWYGWSHRAIFGYGIGSKVNVGSCAFTPKNKYDMFELIKEELEVDESDNPEKEYVVNIEDVDYDVYNTEEIIPTIKSGPLQGVPSLCSIDNNDIEQPIEIKESYVIETDEEIIDESIEEKPLGMLVHTLTEFTGSKSNRKPIKGTIWQMYPEVFGKGTWEAKTLEDAHEMAIEFTKAVS